MAKSLYSKYLNQTEKKNTLNWLWTFSNGASRCTKGVITIFSHFTVKVKIDYTDFKKAINKSPWPEFLVR